MKITRFAVFLLWVLSAATDAAAQAAATFTYGNAAGARDELQSLDVYSGGRPEGAPVVVFVHGGGWVSGNKSNVKRAPKFLEFFEQREIVLVSIGYRLVADAGLPGISFREQATDVAAALKWVHANIRDHNGDPEKIFLLGYSAGAHIVALVGTDDSYLGAQGLELSVLKGVIALDVNSYDIPQAIFEAPSLGVPISPDNLRAVFSADIAAQRAASPVTHVSAGRKYPPTLLVYTGTFDTSPAGVFRNTLSKVQSERFASTLRSAGADVEIYGDLEQTHRGIMQTFGNHDDGITRAIRGFLDRLSK